MELSIFLAKVLGLYFLIVSLGMIFNAGRFKPLIIDLIKSPALMFLTGFLALIIGILLVVSHNIWTADWRVVITILAWLSLIKGTIRIMVPQFAVKTIKKCTENNISYYISGLITLGIGLFLIYHGYLQNPS